MKLKRITFRHILHMTPLMLIFFLPFCKEEPENPPKEVIKAYQQNAHNFCKAIVKCLKQDAEKRLKDHPERAALVTERMDIDLCRKNQYSLIGQHSVSINQGKPELNQEYYHSYENCSRQISSAKDCREKMEIYKSLPDCKKIKEKT